MHSIIHWITWYNNLEMKTTKVPDDRRVGNKALLYIQNKILLSHRNNGIM